MKRVLLTLVIACLAVTGTARADNWGRILPNALVARVYEDGPTEKQAPSAKDAIQAPATTIHSDCGYPFVDRCGCASSCFGQVWAGYARHCGCGNHRAVVGHYGRCAGLSHHCRKCVVGGCDAGCADCAGGGFLNTFAGGGCCSGCGHKLGLGWHAGRLHAIDGCGCGGRHHLQLAHWHGLRRVCGLGCDVGCGCGDHHPSAGGEKQIMNPPKIPEDGSPVVDGSPTLAPSPMPEKSALRAWLPGQALMGGY